ncbi:MAG: DUF6624 domain-containing protein [Candidatus Taylorbacteria bacterium]
MKKVQYPKEGLEISYLYNAAQNMRRKNRKHGTERDPQIDRINASRLKVLISEIGWPTKSKVGKEGSRAAALIALHADDDPAFQYTCFLLMKSEKPPDVELSDIAYLEDRVIVNMTGYQKYGTQYTQECIGYVPWPILNMDMLNLDMDKLNNLRKQMGLGTMEEGIREMYKKYPLKRGKLWITLSKQT